jgi:CBS domain-containing protein
VRISNLLDAKGSSVSTIGPDGRVADVVAELARHGIGALVVSSDGTHIEGIVSERDVVRRLHQMGGDLLDQPVSSIMTSTVRTCSPDDDIESLIVTMTEHRIRHVPVVHEGGVLAGIVSIGDVVKSRMDELEQDRKALVNYINSR